MATALRRRPRRNVVGLLQVLGGANHRLHFFGYTIGMKTAISIPDEIFEEAERLAKRMKKSRSELYRRALVEYIARHAENHVTELMDKAVCEIGDTSEGFIGEASNRLMIEVEW